MVADILKDSEDRMRKTVEVFRRDMASMRAGRATPAMLDKVLVDYYGTPTPINQMATVTTPEPRLLVIQPWDRGMVGAIEKAIAKSDLGVTPVSDGTVIRITLPQLTEARRAEIVKQIRKKGEEERVAIRNIRREANDLLKQLEKDGEISEDECRRAQDSIQKITDRFIEEIDSILEAKEKEIMEV